MAARPLQISPLRLGPAAVGAGQHHGAPPPAPHAAASGALQVLHPLHALQLLQAPPGAAGFLQLCPETAAAAAAAASAHLLAQAQHPVASYEQCLNAFRLTAQHTQTNGLLQHVLWARMVRIRHQAQSYYLQKPNVAALLLNELRRDPLLQEPLDKVHKEHSQFKLLLESEADEAFWMHHCCTASPQILSNISLRKLKAVAGGHKAWDWMMPDARHQCWLDLLAAPNREEVKKRCLAMAAAHACPPAAPVQAAARSVSSISSSSSSADAAVVRSPCSVADAGAAPSAHGALPSSSAPTEEKFPELSQFVEVQISSDVFAVAQVAEVYPDGRIRVHFEEIERDDEELSPASAGDRARIRKLGVGIPESDEEKQRKAEEAQFRQDMCDAGLQIVDCEKDGNCLFRAVAHQMWNDVSRHVDLRRDCCDHLLKHQAHFSSFRVGAGGADFSAYVEARRRDGEWGDHVELHALCELLNRDIEVYAFGEERGVQRPLHIITPSGRAAEAAPAAAASSASAAAPKPQGVIRLSFHGKNHYNSVVPRHPPHPHGGEAATSGNMERLRVEREAAAAAAARRRAEEQAAAAPAAASPPLVSTPPHEQLVPADSDGSSADAASAGSGVHSPPQQCHASRPHEWPSQQLQPQQQAEEQTRVLRAWHAATRQLLASSERSWEKLRVHSEQERTLLAPSLAIAIAALGRWSFYASQKQVRPRARRQQQQRLQGRARRSASSPVVVSAALLLCAARPASLCGGASAAAGSERGAPQAALRCRGGGGRRRRRGSRSLRQRQQQGVALPAAASCSRSSLPHKRSRYAARKD